MARPSVRVQLAPGFDRQVKVLAAGPMEAAAKIVARGQRNRIPVSRDGSNGRPAGYARSMIHVEAGIDALGPWWDIGTGTDALTPDGYNYPLGLELGTRPHSIDAKGADSGGRKVLANKKTGQIFGRHVDHPGTPPFPWLRVALEDLRGATL